MQEWRTRIGQQVVLASSKHLLVETHLNPFERVAVRPGPTVGLVVLMFAWSLALLYVIVVGYQSCREALGIASDCLILAALHFDYLQAVSRGGLAKVERTH